MEDTWQIIWPVFLAEATRQLGGEETAPSRCAAAIILARTSWEAYVNEFIQWRGLPANLKRMSFGESLRGVLSWLGEPEPTLESGCPWRPLHLVNRLRNELVHHKAKPITPGEAPGELLKGLGEVGVDLSPMSGVPWESWLLTPDLAGWVCRTVGAAIELLESKPRGRRRSEREVREHVQAALSALQEIR